MTVCGNMLYEKCPKPQGHEGECGSIKASLDRLAQSELASTMREVGNSLLREALREACSIAAVAIDTDYGFNYTASIAPRARIAELRKLLDAAEPIPLVVPSWRDVAADALREGRALDAIAIMIKSDEKLPFSIAPTTHFEALEAVVVAANDLINRVGAIDGVGRNEREALYRALEAYQRLIGSCPG